jgi:chromosome segregation ATPase
MNVLEWMKEEVPALRDHVEDLRAEWLAFRMVHNTLAAEVRKLREQVQNCKNCVRLFGDRVEFLRVENLRLMDYCNKVSAQNRTARETLAGIAQMLKNEEEACLTPGQRSVLDLLTNGSLSGPQSHRPK